MYQASAALKNAIATGTPQRVLLEFLDGSGNVAKTFSNEDIVVSNGVKLTETFNGDTDLNIGQCPSSEISFTLLNDQGQVTDFQFGTFKAWLGARIDSGSPTGKTKTFTEAGATVTYEFAPLGVFIAKRPDVVRKQMVSITANDQMTLFDTEWPNLTITYPVTMAGLLQAMCSYLGVTCASYSFTNATDLTLTAAPDELPNMTMREVLKWIAEASCSIARFNRDGQLEMAWFTTQSGVVYNEHSYTDFTPSWYAVEQIDGLNVRDTEKSLEATVGSGSNRFIIQNNPFLKGQIPNPT